jgi:hypothetical protein
VRKITTLAPAAAATRAWLISPAAELVHGPTPIADGRILLR